MDAKTDNNYVKAILDVVAFLLYAAAYVVYSLVYALIPSSYKFKKSLDGEIVLITGGGGGLGRLLAMRLARLKAVIVLWDVNKEAIEETVKLVEGVGGRVYGYKCNLCDRNDIYKVAEQTTNEVGHVSILINNAGVVSGGLLLKTPDHLIQRTFEVNSISHFWTAKAFLPKMIQKDHGHIVTIASMAGMVGIRKLVDYCSSKYAAVGFDEALRIELEAEGVKGVKTTCICPYFIQQTGMFNDVNSRFLPRLKPNDVADRVVEAIQREETIVMLPTLFRYVYFLRWVLPWPILSIVLRALVPDATPTGCVPTTPVVKKTIQEKLVDRDSENNLKQRLISERKP